jgi:flavodoxin
MNNYNKVKFLKVAVTAFCFVLLNAAFLSATESAKEKTLILFYSLTGNTKMCCEALQKELGADILQIKDLRKRDTKGFAYFRTAIGSLLGRHTKIEPEHPDLSPYQNIILGSPIWTGKLSMAIRTVIKKNRFDGQQIVIFTTTNGFEKEERKEKSRDLVRKAGGTVVGYFQVAVKEETEKDEERVDRPKEQIVEDALKFVPDIRKAFALTE